VPIACINDPKTYGRNEELQRMLSKKSPKAKNLKIKIRYQSRDIMISTNNKAKIPEAKMTFLETAELTKQVEDDSVRFFCLGKELKNEFFLYSYDISEDTVIQAMARLKPETKAEEN